MRIAILIGHFPPGSFGGAEIQAEQWAERLSHRHEIVVVTRRDPPTQPAMEERPGYSVLRLSVSPIPMWRTLADAAAIEKTVTRMEPRPDVLLCFQTFLSGAVGVRLQRRLGIPAIVWIRGEGEYRFEQSRVHRWVGPWTWRHAEGILVQSEQNRRGFLEAYARESSSGAAARAQRLEVIGNGVELPESVRPLGRGLITVGRLIADKGMDLVIEAAAAESVPLVVVGDGPERTALEARARALRADCRFEGFVSRERLDELYGDSGMSVLAARRGEGLPNVLLEAMAHGRPAVATPCAGTTDLLLDDVNGRIVPPGDVRALGKAFAEFRDHPDRAARWGAEARRRAEESSWGHWEERLEAVLHKWVGRA